MAFSNMVSWCVRRALDVIVPLTLGPMLLFLAPATYLLSFVRRRVLGWKSWSPDNKVIIVTGASSGIGEELAYEFARKKARLVLVARREHKLEGIAEKCLNLGARAAEVLPTDLSHEDECQRMIDSCIDKFGRLDVLVNNASIASGYLFSDATTLDAVTPVMDANYWGYVWPTLHALPHLKQSGGHILATVSSVTYLPLPRFAIYNASKLALWQFFDTLRIELAKSSVGMTLVFPGIISSEMTAGKFQSEDGDMVLDPSRRDELTGPIPMLGASTCAKAMVASACRNDRYLITPFWVRAFLLVRLLAPEALDLAMWLYLLPWTSKGVAPSKTTVDAIGARSWLFHPPARSGQEARASMEVPPGRSTA